MLDMLFEMIDEAKNVPLSGDKCMIERDRALEDVYKRQEFGRRRPGLKWITCWTGTVPNSARDNAS